jgi:hypothetical protein
MWGLLIIFAGSAGITALLVNRLQVFFIRKQFRRPFSGLSPELSRVWANSRIWNFASRNAVVGATAGVNTAQALYHLSQIDQQVLKAIDAIYDPSQVNSYQQILGHLADKRNAGATVWQGAVSNYKGRVGEEFLTEHLRAAGHLVIPAESTSQKGWDAIVDGQAVNFKAGLGTAHIQEHLTRFPDIPVITVAEHAETFSSNPRVTCLEGVSGHEIAEATEDTMESAIDLGDFGFELPLVTMALASARNFSPVFEGHSDVGTALKHTAADTAGGGFGAAGGAKAGAMLGAFAGPLGAAAGAILGGLGGAIGGKWIAKNFKERNLREAVSTFDQRVTDYGRAYIHGLQAKANALEEAAALMTKKLSFRRLIAPTPGDILRRDVRLAYKRWARYCRDQARALTMQAMPQGETEPRFIIIGRSVLSSSSEEPVYNLMIQECLKRITESVERIKAEKLRLGYS